MNEASFVQTKLASLLWRMKGDRVTSRSQRA